MRRFVVRSELDGVLQGARNFAGAVEIQREEHDERAAGFKDLIGRTAGLITEEPDLCFEIVAGEAGGAIAGFHVDTVQSVTE